VLDLLIPNFFSMWLNTSEIQTLKSANWSTWLDAIQVQVLLQPEFAPDAIAETAIQQHLAQLAQQGLAEAEQGVWIQTGNQVLGGNQGDVPLPAASLTKVATTLAALLTWEPNHQFETLVSTTGPVEAGTLQGDLIVQGSGDPLFVWEEAIALGNALNQAGINRITGNLVITGDFAMNYETDPVTAGNLLRQGISSTFWSGEIENQYRMLPANTPRPQVVIEGSVQAASLEQVNSFSSQPIIRHRSLPLSQILKAMNIYSNNVMSEMLADSLGGAETVAQLCADAANVSVEEIQIINGSGLGVENQISARAVVAMLTAIQRNLQPKSLNVADLFPVIGRDRGTLTGRRIPVSAAVKTGTLAQVSSLAGVIQTRDRGLVWFAIINRGWNLAELRNQQDILLQNLTNQWGAELTTLPTLTPSEISRLESNQLGAASRNEIL
jgi:D-alanyl-D-alanine carboxypeptidase/D-alanyl-D-alanine-endopeptidase (penicillin-binding protein 4)